MNIGLLQPGFSSDEQDHAIPVQDALVRTLARDNHVRVLALRYPHRRDYYRAFGADVIALGAAQTRALGRLALWRRALLTLRELHREKPFDVLHATWADETGLIAAWAGHLLRVPVVVSVAGGELTRLDDIDYGLQRSRFSRWIVGQALSGADAVVLAGNYAQERFDQCGYRIPDSRLHILPLGVDTTRFAPADEKREPNRLLHVASLVGVKDQATLLRALARLDDNVQLDIIGDGAERERLNRLAAELSIAGRIRFLDALPHVDLPLHYRRAALHVLSSRSEALPISALEAAACGLYTVSTAAGALAEYPAIATTVPIGDDAALADAIQNLLSDHIRRWTLGHEAATVARDYFSIERAAGRFLQLYANLIKERARARP